MEFTDWDLDARPLSHLKFYSVPFNTINDLEEPVEDDEEEEEVDKTDIVTTLIKIGMNMKESEPQLILRQ